MQQVVEALPTDRLEKLQAFTLEYADSDDTWLTQLAILVTAELERRRKNGAC